MKLTAIPVALGFSLATTSCVGVDAGDEAVDDTATSEQGLSYGADVDNGAVLLMRHAQAFDTGFKPVCTMTALANGTPYSNFFVTAKHCLTDERVVGANATGVWPAVTQQVKSLWAEYAVTPEMFCVQQGGGTGAGTCNGGARPATGTPGTTTSIYRVWAPADQSADFAIVQTYNPITVTPQYLTHTWGYAAIDSNADGVADTSAWVSQAAKDVPWATITANTYSTYMYGFQTERQGQPYNSYYFNGQSWIANTAHQHYSYFSYTSSSDPADRRYDNGWVSDYVSSGFTAYLTPMAGNANAAPVNAGGPLFTTYFPASSTLTKGYWNSTLLGIISTTTFDDTSALGSGNMKGVITDLSATDARATGVVTAQEIARWLNTPPGNPWSDFCTMHGYYNGYDCYVGGVAASMAGVNGTTYTTYSHSTGLTLSLTDTTGSQNGVGSISTLKNYVNNYYFYGSSVYAWYRGAIAQGGYGDLSSTNTTSGASLRSYARAVKANQLADMPQLRPSATGRGFVDAQLCDAAHTATGYDRGCAADAGNDNVSYLGQSCDARDPNGKPCATASGLACAATQDHDWRGNDRSNPAASSQFRCVVADPTYYYNMPTRCFDVWVGRTPDAAGGAADSRHALMYQLTQTAPTAAGSWQRACGVGTNYVQYQLASEPNQGPAFTVSNDTGVSSCVDTACQSQVFLSGTWRNRTTNASQAHASCNQTAAPSANAADGCPVGFFCAESLSGDGMCTEIPADDF